MNAKQFLEAISRDKSLELQVLVGGWNVSQMVALGTARGYKFSATELQNAMDETFGVLSEEELRNAAGGGGPKDDHGPKTPPEPGNASACSFFYGN